MLNGTGLRPYASVAGSACGRPTLCAVLPNLIIIGAQKAGTTSLHRYLDLHPEVAMSSRKELDFFAGPGWEWERGIEWYESHFSRDAPVVGESSPSYSAHPWVPGVPERMHSLIPEARLVYVVRDPVDRMVSEYFHYRTAGRELRPIREVFSHPRMSESGYVVKSRYHMQLERYLRHFPRERILVVAQEDLLDRRDATLRRVFRFLDVDEDFRSLGFDQTYNRGGSESRSHPRRVMGALGRRLTRVLEARLPAAPHKPARASARPASPLHVEDSLRDELRHHFIRDATRLRELTGEQYESWCV